jgi:hypothetical protein
MNSKRATFQKPKCRRPPKARVRVLVVLSSNGFVEIFGPPEVDAHVAQRLDVPPECEIKAEEYLDATLPKRYRDLFFPGKVRAIGLVQKITPEQAGDTLWKLSILRGLRAMRQEQRAFVVPKAIQRRRAIA